MRRDARDAHYVVASKVVHRLLGAGGDRVRALANLAENLIQAVNILGSIFYGVVLGLFLVAFFLKRVGGTAVFWAALAAQALVFVLYSTLSIILSLVQRDRLRGLRRVQPRSAGRPGRRRAAANRPTP